MSDQHERYEDDVGAYLLEALSVEEARSFERHLASCERCRLELARLRAAADALPRSVDPVEPPAALKRSLMRAVRADAAARSREERQRGVRAALLGGLSLRLRPLAAAAVVVLVAGVAIGYGIRGKGAGTRVVVGAVDRARVPNASARLVIPTGRGAGGVLQVAGMPAPPPGYIYELWLRRGAEVVPSSLFSVGTNGRGAAAIDQSLSGVSAVLVTREHARGASAPTGPTVIRVRT